MGRLSVLAWRYTHPFTAMTVRVSAFVDGAQNSQEITHQKNLVDARSEAENFIRTMAGLGDRCEFPSGHSRLKRERDDDLAWWSDLVGRFVNEGKTVFAYANNHYQNHSPSTLQRFLEIRRGEQK